MYTKQFFLRCYRDDSTRVCDVICHEENGVNHRVFNGCPCLDSSVACGSCQSVMQGLLDLNPNISLQDLATAHASGRARQ